MAALVDVVGVPWGMALDKEGTKAAEMDVVAEEHVLFDDGDEAVDDGGHGG